MLTWTVDLIQKWSQNTSVFNGQDSALLLRLFREFFRSHWRNYIVVFVSIGIVGAVTGLVAYMVKDVVNSIFVEQQRHLLFFFVLALFGIFLLKGAASYLQMVFSARISNAIVQDIQLRLMETALRARVDFFSRHGSDDLLMRFNQGSQGFGSILNSVLLNGLRDAVTLASLLLVMVVQDPWLTLVSVSVGPMIFLGIAVLLRRLKDLVSMELAGHAGLNRLVREAAQGITTIKAFNMEGQIYANATHVISGIRKQRDKIVALQAAPLPLLDTLGGLAVTLAIAYAGYRSMYTAYDPGTFLSFLSALLLASDPARRLGKLRTDLRTGLAAAQMVYDVLDQDSAEDGQPSLTRAQQRHPVQHPPPKRSKASEKNAVEFNNVGFEYPNGANALNDITFSVKPGEVFALVGPSGAGKSTILKLLLKFYAPTRGCISVNDQDLALLNPVQVRQLITYVGQSNFIFSGSVLDNISLNIEGATPEAVENACRIVGLHEEIMALPGGYSANVGELGGLISGGQAQRLNMARALLRNSPVLLLDEVTASLDADNEDLIRRYVASQQGTKTIIVISHRLSSVRGANRIALLENGRVRACAPHGDLIEEDDYYKRIVAMQAIH